MNINIYKQLTRLPTLLGLSLPPLLRLALLLALATVLYASVTTYPYSSSNNIRSVYVDIYFYSFSILSFFFFD